jgi:hypothetical protein
LQLKIKDGQQEMSKLFSPYRQFLLLLVFVALTANASQAEIKEKDVLLNSPVLGDFRKARQIKGKGRASLKIWQSYLDYLDKYPQARVSSPKGQDSLEVAYDEIWVLQGAGYPNSGRKGQHNGEPDIGKLYWKGGRAQAYTLERCYTANPITWRKFPKPAYKLVAIFNRDFLVPEIANQAARDQVFRALTALDHLQEARKALLEGQPDDTDIRKRTYGRLADARAHLEAIGQDSEEYREARNLLKEVARREEDRKKFQEVLRQDAAAQLRKQREELVAEMDRDFLEKGMDVKIELGGSEKTTLRLDCLLFTRPMVYIFLDKTDLLPRLKQAGFQEVVFSNKSIKYSWEIDLDNL